MLLSRTKEYTVFVDASIKPTILVPVRFRSIVSKVWERIKEVFSISPQLAVLSGLYHYCRVKPEGARPRDLYKFLSRLGVDIKENTLRAELSYLVRKGMVEKTARRYRIRENITLSGIEALVDLGRAKAGRVRWEEPKHRDRRPKYSLDPRELLQKYNIHNLRENVKSLIRENEIKALATLIALGGGLRPNDRLIELGYKDEFYAVIYEPKCDRYRLICEENDVLWRELLKDEEIKKWFLEVIKRHDEEWLKWSYKQEYKWRVSKGDWSLIASNIRQRRNGIR